ncbi:MFS transporter [Serinicoccus sp. LYQ131]|uniref:MFS transporter n=1 Tax=Serinicoccus sp. LYQ131 TaxID=3378797 RepID=UPI003851FD71
MSTRPAQEYLSATSTRGRVMLAAVTLGSGVAILDGSVVNVALRSIGDDLGATLPQLQWVIGGYLLALASLVLVAGALGDRLGRRRVYLVGMTWFLVASALCALAQDPWQLVGARVVQGVGAALLTPGALALIQASFAPGERARAIGTWAGVSGIAAAVGPLVGGAIVDTTTWRWIFAINIPICLVVVALTWWSAPESRDTESTGAFDVVGALLVVLTLGASTWALTTAAEASTGALVLAWVVTGLGTAGFLLRSRRTAYPLVPLHLFSSRVFSAANAMTLLVYAALGAVMLFVVVQLQVSSGWSALDSGLAGLPVTVALLLLSPRAAALADRIGPRVPMTVGPLVCGLGVAMMVGIGEGTRWWGVLPGMVVFALGLALLVSPLTAAVLAAVADRFAGLASGINNAVARTGSLLAVAALPALVGLSGDDYTDPVAFTAGYRWAMVVCALLLVAGGLVSWLGLREQGPGAEKREARA